MKEIYRKIINTEKFINYKPIINELIEEVELKDELIIVLVLILIVMKKNKITRGTRIK